VNETKLYGFFALNSVAPDVAAEHLLEKGPAYAKTDESAGRAGGKRDWPTFRQNTARAGVAQTELSEELRPRWMVKVPSATAPVVAKGRVFIASRDTHSVYALDARAGTTLWTFTAGGRIDSPPTYNEGRVLFGSVDGWVYCLAAETGDLSWKFRAAPQEKLTVAFGQIESLWPVPGNILVVNQTAYFVAGRQSFLDGGLYLFGLDVNNGSKKYETRISGPFGEDGESVFDEKNQRQIKGNKSDILVSDGELIYLRHMAFHQDLTPAEQARDHLLSVSGFLDSAGHHRSYWTIAPRLIYDTNIADYIDADLLVFDAEQAFGTRISKSNRGPESFDVRQRGFMLFSMTHDKTRAAELRQKQVAAKRGKKLNTTAKRNLSSLARSRSSYFMDWEIGIPVNGKAMIKSGEVLLIAGTRGEFPEDDLYRAVEGRSGGVLVVCSCADGAIQATFDLESPPVWDGMAAAGGNLYVSLASGHLQCWGQEG
jgi:hypothetical protein